MIDLTAPCLLSIEHALLDFDSGELSLNDWLKQRALKNQLSGASRCFVICNGQKVIGYYSLSAGAIGHDSAPKIMRRNMPNPVPVLLLGRLAIDKHFHNQGLGSALLRDAMMRAMSIADDAGIFAVLVHALSEPAKQYYLSRGFVVSPIQPMTLIVTLETVRAILSTTNA
ncbi:MAG: GNAT family N-acetyltransferase [Legionellaceae bacterium]|nr:GNAT family N-acetyltransferase [Legionellaceae bacterium]